MLTDAELRITYTTTLNDLVAFNRHVLLSTKMRRLFLPIFVLFFALPIVQTFVQNLHKGAVAVVNGLIGYILFLIPALLFGAIVLALYIRASMKLIAKTTPDFDAVRTVVIDDDAVSYEDPIRMSRTRWCGISSIEQNAGYIFISMNQAQAYVIPKRAFASPGDADRFYQTAWQLWKGARPSGPGNPW